jgi:hypothetical protein
MMFIRPRQSRLGNRGFPICHLDTKGFPSLSNSLTKTRMLRVVLPDPGSVMLVSLVRRSSAIVIDAIGGSKASALRFYRYLASNLFDPYHPRTSRHARTRPQVAAEASWRLASWRLASWQLTSWRLTGAGRWAGGRRRRRAGTAGQGELRAATAHENAIVGAACCFEMLSR